MHKNKKEQANQSSFPC